MDDKSATPEVAEGSNFDQENSYQTINENEKSLAEESHNRDVWTNANSSPSSSKTTNPFVAHIDRSSGRSSNASPSKKPSDENVFPGGMSPRTSVGLRPPGYTIPGPNAIRIPPDDFLNTLVGFSNMYLAHEISINPEFKLERFAPAQDSMEYQVKHQMKRAFWDVLNEQLELVPPNYMQALSIFEEIKTMLLSLLMPHHQTLRTRINEELDMDLIRQQVQKECLDFPKYAAFLIEILSQLCAPSRDEEVAALKQLTKPVEVFQGILEVMESMKLDMANFYIQQFRPAVVQNCLQYERTKFADFLELEYRMEEDGLRNTRQWLLKHKEGGRGTNTTICKAFAEILWWADEQIEWPETVTLDAERLSKISKSIKRLGIVGGIILTSESLSQSILPKPTTELRSLLKQQLESLVSEEDVNNENLKECLDRVGEQVVMLIGEILSSQSDRALEDAQKDSVRNAIKDLVQKENKIRHLLVKRTVEFAESWLTNGKSAPLPSGLNCIGEEVVTTVKSFFRIFQYNRAIFDVIYVTLIEDKTAPENINVWQHIEPSLKAVLKALSTKDASV